MNKSFSIREVVREGWDTFKANARFFILASLVYIVISSIPTFIEWIEKEITGLSGDPVFVLLAALIRIAVFILGLIMPIGYTYILLRAVDKQSFEIKDLFSAHGVFWKFIIAGLLTSLIIFVGFILVIVPGVFFAIALMFTSYVVVDEHVSATKAIKKSYGLTRGVRWKLFGFIIVVILINILGFIALGVGFLVSMPVSGLASVHLYRTLKHGYAELMSKSELTPVSSIQDTPVAVS